MSLPASDQQYLADRGIAHQVSVESSMVCVVVSSYDLPPGFDRASADLLLRLSAGYPDVAPDMWWFSPPVRRSDGVEIVATQAMERHLNRDWQRWSRHFNAGQWKSGIDGIESFLALIRSDLVQHALKAA